VTLELSWRLVLCPPVYFEIIEIYLEITHDHFLILSVSNYVIHFILVLTFFVFRF
jgi:hypothetical protein